MDIAKQLSKSLSDRIVIAKVCHGFHSLYLVAENYQVDGELWDLERPLEKSVKIELLDFENPEGELPRNWLSYVFISCVVTRQKGFLALFCARSRGGC